MGYWSQVPDDWAALSDNSPGAQQIREDVFGLLDKNHFHEFAWPFRLKAFFEQWVAGDFENDWASPVPAASGPALLDQAALENCVGANFFPGIEVGHTITTAAWYAAPFRFSHATVQAGDLTLNMALPWQADFNDCDHDWWPSQRPSEVFEGAANVPEGDVVWAHGIYTGMNATSREDMVQNFAKLGFVVPQQLGDVEFTKRIDLILSLQGLESRHPLAIRGPDRGNYCRW